MKRHTASHFLEISKIITLLKILPQKFKMRKSLWDALEVMNILSINQTILRMINFLWYSLCSSMAAVITLITTNWTCLADYFLGIFGSALKTVYIFKLFTCTWPCPIKNEHCTSIATILPADRWKRERETRRGIEKNIFNLPQRDRWVS